MKFNQNYILCLILLSCLDLITVSDAQGFNECPPGYEEHPVILVSMDGFRYDYLERGLTPTIQAFKNGGASVPYMKSSYPTITFPNHYAIVTGLYPESHGIIDNHFYDPINDAYFDIGTNESLQSKWWGGDPIWNTVVKQGKISATILWPGSDANIEEMHATYWYKYDESMPFPDRVNQVLEWLSLPKEERPVFINLYFEQPDSNGHKYGPDSLEVNQTLIEMDLQFASLLNGIEEMNLTSCVNVILVSDHGMAESGNDYIIPLYNYVPAIRQLALIYQYVLVRMYVYDEGNIDVIRENLTCQTPQMRQYDRAGLPTRFHYSNSDKIGDIVLDLTVGYEGLSRAPLFQMDLGDHGYDNYNPEMQAMFMASGPEFRSGIEIEPFQNIEIYNLLCHLVNVIPSPNNGTMGSLYQLLKNPPGYPTTPQEDAPPEAEFPVEPILEQRLNISGCNGDLLVPQAWIYNLNMTEESKNNSEKLNLPWGIPNSGDLPADIVLLYQEDHITGYSQVLKMPLWTSFTVNASSSGSPQADWSSDVRLSSDNSPTCQSYETLLQQNITMEPLFPKRYSKDPSFLNIPFLVSNAVPMTSLLQQRWINLVEEILLTWIQSSSGPLNVVIGPLFDNNADSLVDDFTTFTNSPEVPSDLFMIVTRCLNAVSDLQECDPSALDAISFIYPEIDRIPNCLDTTDYALKFSAKVKDVEIATGFTFYPSLSYESRMMLQIRIHSSLWAPFNVFLN